MVREARASGEPAASGPPCHDPGQTDRPQRAAPVSEGQASEGQASTARRPSPRLRVVDAGAVSAVRSQALWHGIAEALAPGDDPVLSLCSTTSPYVGIGYHRPLAELDLEACAARRLPVLRRQLGGGPVYVDADQLLFQLTLPARRAPASVDRLYRELLAPALAAFRRLGVAARLSGRNDLAAGARKVSGTGAGRIGEAVTVVGNVIFRFAPERMVEVLALPGDGARGACLELMRRHLASLADLGLHDVTPEQAREALVAEYARVLGAAVVASSLTSAEERAVADWEARLVDPEWRAGPPASPRARERGRMRQVKVSAEAWLCLFEAADMALEMAVAGGTVQRFVARGAAIDGAATALGERLRGLAAEPAAVRAGLQPFGELGDRLAATLIPGLTPP